MSLTEAQRDVAADILCEFSLVIRDAGPNGIPSGHLYAVLCDKLSLQAYTNIVTLLKLTGLVEEKHHVLRYIGPPKV